MRTRLPSRAKLGLISRRMATKTAPVERFGCHLVLSCRAAHLGVTG